MKQEIQRHLRRTCTVGREIRCFAELGSTNTYAKELIHEGEGVHGLAVLAEHQTAGRGRMERTFQSPGGKGIYLTVLLRWKLPTERLLSVTALAGVAVCEAVERVCGLRPGLKWPNDPVLHGKKICGILTELVTAPDGAMWVVLGVGVNVSQCPSDFTPDVAEMATSLFAELTHSVSREPLIAALLEELDRMYRDLREGDISAWLAVYRQDCVNLGKTVRLMRSEGSVTALAVDIDDLFGLVVCHPDGSRETIRSGEVSVRGLYGYVE